MHLNNAYNFFYCRYVFNEQNKINNEIDDIEKRNRVYNIKFNDIENNNFFCNKLKKRKRH